MRRKQDHDLLETEWVPQASIPFDSSKWASAEEAAILLRKFRRKDGKPSVGAIRNMIYRKQIVAKKFFGRILILREYLNQLVAMAPNTKGA